MNLTEKTKAPLSRQIRFYNDTKNNALGKYRRYFTPTNLLGEATIFFDNLVPASNYSLYITSTSYLPY